MRRGSLDSTAEPSQVAVGAAVTVFRSDVLAQFVLPRELGAYAAVAPSSLVFEPADEEVQTVYCPTEEDHDFDGDASTSARSRCATTPVGWRCSSR
jgi:hypothetical protein